VVPVRSRVVGLKHSSAIRYMSQFEQDYAGSTNVCVGLSRNRLFVQVGQPEHKGQADGAYPFSKGGVKEHQFFF